LWLGLALLAAGAVASLAGAGNAASALLAPGGAALGGATVMASRGSVAARVAASAALTLLLVVLVLAIGLSAVLTSTVEGQAKARLATRAANEAKFISDPVVPRLDDAKIVGASLKSDRVAELRNATDPNAARDLTDAITSLSTNFLESRPAVYIDAATGAVIAATPNLRDSAIALAGTPAVKEAIAKVQPVGSVQLVRGRLLVIGVQPVSDVVNGVRRVLGVAVAATPIDNSYLEPRVFGETDLSLAVVDRTDYLASFGPRPPVGAVRAAVEAVFVDPTAKPTGVAGGRFFSVAAVLASDRRPVAAVVASQPTTVVADTRDKLYRVLFLIALGGAMLALALASVVGSRIGASLRRLTLAAEGIQRGDFSTRAALESEDEVGVLGAAFDSMALSIQEKTEELADARSRLEAVVAGMGEALVAVDIEGRVTEFNRSAEELTGITAADARGRTADDVLDLSSDDGASLGRRLRKPSPARWSAEGSLRTHDGDVPVAVSAGTLRGMGDELVGGVYVLRDLRREREVERMKTEFLSRIGHELRTPLTGVKGYAELLVRKEVPAPLARQWHNEILKQANALYRIVQMLEFFASSGAGRTMLRPGPIDLREIVNGVVAHRTAALNGNGAGGTQWSISRRIARGLPPVVADERWLAMSIDELVDNAVKFSPNGGKVSVTVEPADNGRVEIAVTDRGKGMTREEQALAFAEFVQGDTSDTRSFGGLGLGLSLVQRVAEAHGGTVTCVSQPGKGSKFSIFLPGAPIRTRR
jgi:PAS domain S-box-containing protein